MGTSDYPDLGGVFLPGAFMNDFARGFAGPPGDFLVDDERSEMLVNLGFGHLPVVAFGKGRLEEWLWCINRGNTKEINVLLFCVKSKNVMNSTSCIIHAPTPPEKENTASWPVLWLEEVSHMAGSAKIDELHSRKMAESWANDAESRNRRRLPHNSGIYRIVVLCREGI